MEGNASVYQVNPVSRITGRSFQGRGGLGLIKRERGRGVGGTGGAAQSVRRNYKSFNGINLTVVERMHQFRGIYSIDRWSRDNINTPSQPVCFHNSQTNVWRHRVSLHAQHAFQRLCKAAIPTQELRLCNIISATIYMPWSIIIPGSTYFINLFSRRHHQLWVRRV